MGSKTHFGTRVSDQSKEEFTKALEDEKGGVNIFGTRVVGRADGDNPKLRAEAQSEFGVRVANEVKAEGTKKGESVNLPAEKLDSLLEMNPTMFDSLYSAEFGRAEGPRKEVLNIFKVHEIGRKGEGRQFIVDEINRALGEVTPQAAARAAFAKAEQERIEQQMQREEENIKLGDLDRVKALKERDEALTYLKKADNEGTRSQMISPDAESQNRQIQGDNGDDPASRGAQAQKTEGPLLDRGPTRAETQHPDRASQKDREKSGGHPKKTGK